MTGIDKATGKALSGLAHLKQSINDILTTPLGSRVMRRDYGSRLFQLIDAPLNSETLVEIYAATAEALLKWEPRFKLHSVKASRVQATGRVEIILTGEYLPEGKSITLEGIIL
ncbi:GPW/gp25 family protein [Lentisphaerota bacterium ZTH]|nr:GPW/gp25 family protein [Lentisphaerota bacterium]WET05826.1 GPW/gp25 family protein [Lentisphaerota bacterium ZTH]